MRAQDIATANASRYPLLDFEGSRPRVHTGKQLSLQQQIDNLRTLGESTTMRLLLPGAVLLAAAALFAFYQSDSETWRVLCLFVAGCSGLVALAAALSAKHLRNAASATRKGRREPATLHLEPYEDDDERRFRGRLELTSSGGRVWQLDLAPAAGWKPKVGAMQVQAVFLSDISWPVLLLCGDQGLLWPNHDPRLFQPPGAA